MEKRIRSPNYPALSLRTAIDKVAILYKSLHTHSAPREVIAKGLGYQTLNGTSATAISGLHKYGLIERDGDEIKISERAMRLLLPQSPEERIQAIQEAANTPPLFVELADRFPGNMPSDDVLRNYLLRKGFSPAAVSNVVLSFRETKELVEHEVGAYDSPQSTPIVAEVQAPMQLQSLISSSVQQSRNIQLNQSVERILGHWDFEGGGHVRILSGGAISTEEALAMAETLINMRRAEIKTRSSIAASNPMLDEKKSGGKDDLSS